MLGWLLALLRAVPSLERLFVNIGEQLKAHRAETKYEEELDHIDVAINAAHGGVQDSRVSGFEWSEEPDRSSSIPNGSKDSTGVHSFSFEGSGKVEQNNKE